MGTSRVGESLSSRYGEVTDERATDEAVFASHPGFTILCQDCGSNRVYVDNTLGYSAASGSWGEISLVCHSCGATTEIVSS